MNLILPIIISAAIVGATFGTGQTKPDTGQAKIASGSAKLGFVISDFARDIKLGESIQKKNPDKRLPQVAAVETIKAALGNPKLGLRPVVVSVTPKPEEIQQPTSTLSSPSPEPSGEDNQESAGSYKHSPTPCPSPSPSPEETSSQEDEGNLEDWDIQKYEQGDVLGVLFSFVDKGLRQLQNSQSRSDNDLCDGVDSQTFEGAATGDEEDITGGTDQGPWDGDDVNEPPTVPAPGE